MEIRPYKLHKIEGVLECQLYSIENSQMDNESRMESLGIYNKSKVHGQPINAVIDLKALGEIMFFLPNRIEIYEDFNFVDATSVEFGENLSLVILIPFEDFKRIYLEYKGITDGN